MRILFAPSARRFLDKQTAAVVSKLISDIVWLRGQPYFQPDNPQIRPFVASPAVFRLFQDEFHWVIYYINNKATGPEFIVANIGDALETPHLWRADDST